MRYRRCRRPGGTYFFTVNLADRRSRLLIERVDMLRESVRKVKRRHPFDILGWVVLPEQLHALWTLPEGDGDNAKRWPLIKSTFSRGSPPCGGHWREPPGQGRARPVAAQVPGTPRRR